MIKILIVKLSAIGDVVHALPCLPMLKKYYPESEISWVVEEKAKDILLGNKFIDEIVIINTKKWRQNFFSPANIKEIKNALKVIRGKKFDIAIDIQGLIKSGVITFLSGASRKIGFNKVNCREPLNTIFTNIQANAIKTETHIVEKNLAPVECLGINTTAQKKEFFIDIPDNEINKANNFYKKNNLYENDILIGLNPGAGWETKLWSVDNYASLANKIIKIFNVKIIIFWGSKKEKELANKINSKMHENAIIPNKNTIKEYCALSKRCTLIVGPDTGPMHIADALGVTTVSLFGPSSVSRNKPYLKGITVSGDCEKTGCYKRKCELKPCMNSISYDEVFKEVSTILKLT